YGTAAPAPNARDWTATPSSFVAGSRATIENVENQSLVELAAPWSWPNAETEEIMMSRDKTSAFITWPPMLDAVNSTSSGSIENDEMESLYAADRNGRDHLRFSGYGDAYRGHCRPSLRNCSGS